MADLYGSGIKQEKQQSASSALVNNIGRPQSPSGAAETMALTVWSGAESKVLQTASSAPKRLCLVCGDQASGFHYGVASCEACKAFFKRTIQGNIEYTCPANSDCEINKRRRKACQACRFHKCLRMGMLKEGVRLDRVRGGRQKYRRSNESGSNSYQTTVEVTASRDHGSSPVRALSYRGSSQASDQYPCSNNSLSAYSSHNGDTPRKTPNSQKKSHLESTALLKALNDSEPDMNLLALPGHSDNIPLSRGGKRLKAEAHRDTMSKFGDVTDKELVAVIGFAKQFPGFTDLLLNDQMRILQATWAEMMSLTIAYRSQQLIMNEMKLFIGGDLIIDEKSADSCGMNALFLELALLTRRVLQLDLSKEEYLIIKSIILTNTDIQLEDEEAVRKLRDFAQSALVDVVSYSSPPISMGRLSSVLLMLPLIRQLDVTMRSYWVKVRADGRIPFNKLFNEMLDSKVAPMRSDHRDLFG